MPHRRSREVEALVAGRHGDPFAFLGMHKASAGIYVRAMLPDAERMAVIDAASGEIAAQGERIHPGIFRRLTGRLSALDPAALASLRRRADAGGGAGRNGKVGVVVG